MKLAVVIAFFVVGAVNTLPVVGVFGASPLIRLYELPTMPPDVVLLLRHRAVLLALVGVLLMAAAIHAPLRGVGTVVGLVSMLSYALLAFTSGSEGERLLRVAWVDVVASVVLVTAAIAHARSAP